MSPALKSRIVLAARLAFVALVIFAIARGPKIVWRLLPAKRAHIAILDKTVAHDDYREHACLPWLLHALKVQTPDGRYYDATRDYVGFDPITRVGHDLKEADLIHGL